MSDRDYYEILGLTPGADRYMIDQAYWHLARKFQTLGATEPQARYMLDELNEAYGVLGTPPLRTQYDAFRDDVLIQSGMLQPVSSKPKRRKKKASAEEPAPQREWRIPALRLASWRTYCIAGVVAVLAFAAAWEGVNPLFVIIALVGGLALALTPVLKRQISAVNVSMPSFALPEISAPRIALPKIAELNLPKIAELGGGAERDEPLDPDELQASTSAMISRWRKSVGLRTLDYDNPLPDATDAPLTTLLDIVENEHDIEGVRPKVASGVIDVLRATQRSAAE